MSAGSLRVKEQPEQRISQVWTYYGQRNPLEGQTDVDNYKQWEVGQDTETEAENAYGAPRIKRIFSRWIATGGRTTATRLNDLMIARFKTPPRHVTFEAMRSIGVALPELGGGYYVSGFSIQDADGSASQIPIQVTRVDPMQHGLKVEAEELLFEGFVSDDDTDRTITIAADDYNLNFRTLHDALYPAPLSGDEVTLVIASGVTVGSTSTSTPALNVGSWPAGVTLNIEVSGRIQGAGGAGGTVGGTATGGAGGVALKTVETCNVTVNASGDIWGGGGGGGRAFFSDAGGGVNGGGGGAGTNGGAGGSGSGNGDDGFDGNATAGGNGGKVGTGDGGNGGGPGLDGDDGTGTPVYAGGSAGAAIDGISFITLTDNGDIRGSQIN